MEALLALRALARARVDITMVTPELQFFNRSMSVEQPFKPKRGRGIRLENMFASSTPAGFGTSWTVSSMNGAWRAPRAASASPTTGS